MDYLTAKISSFKNEKSNYYINLNKDGLLHGIDGKPSIIQNVFGDNSKIGTLYIYHNNGVIDNKGEPAVIFNYDYGEIKFFIENDKLVDNGNGCIRVEEHSQNLEVYHLNSNFNYHYITNNNDFKIKSRMIIFEKKIISHIKKISNQIISSNKDFNELNKNIASLRWHFNDFIKFKSCNIKPSQLYFYKDKLKKAFWLDQEGAYHRKNKPAIIDFVDYKSVMYSYYEHGLEKEDIFTPYKSSLCRKTLKPLDEFYFKNKEIQRFYNEHELNPFDLSISGKELVICNFKI